jgi:hypothetical protein
MNDIQPARDIDDFISRTGKYAPEVLPTEVRIDKLERHVNSLIVFNIVLIGLVIPFILAITWN